MLSIMIWQLALLFSHIVKLPGALLVAILIFINKTLAAILLYVSLFIFLFVSIFLFFFQSKMQYLLANMNQLIYRSLPNQHARQLLLNGSMNR